MAIYARVSTDNQVGGRFDSCESQVTVCREYLKQRADLGWVEHVAITDAAYSGGTMNRPGLQRVQSLIESGQVKVVLIFKLERMSRNIDEWGPFRAFLDRHGCRLVSATEDISEDEPEGRLKNNIMLSVADFERRNTAKKTRIKMREQAKRGYWNGGNVPYGFSYDKNTQTLQPHPVEGPIVRRIFEEAAALTSLTDLANSLNAEGIRTKQRIWHRRDGTETLVGGGMFRSDGLRLILRNPLYRGAVKFEGQEYPAEHTSLVTSDLWDKANAAHAVTIERPERVFRERDIHNHLLKSVAWCGSCGSALVPSDSGKLSKSGIKYRYYTCGQIIRNATAHSCPVGRVPADALEQAVIAVIGEASQHPSIVSEMVETTRRHRVDDRTTLQKEIAAIAKELSATDTKLANFADAVASKGAEALGDILIRRATELRERRLKLLFEQETKRRELLAIEATVLEEGRIRQNLQRLRKILPGLDPKEQKELIRLVVAKVEVRRVPVNPRLKATDADESKLMDIRIKLHLAELVQDLEARAGQKPSQRPLVSIRGLNLNASVDFSLANRGEVTVLTPFRQPIQLHDRVRTPPKPKVKVEHPILKAREWQRLLATGEVANRVALASRMKLTPGAITRIMKLVNLAPDIQAYLAALNSPSAIWHFGYKPMGRLAEFPIARQHAEFLKLRTDYERMEERRQRRNGLVPIGISKLPKTTPKMSA